MKTTLILLALCSLTAFAKDNMALKQNLIALWTFQQNPVTFQMHDHAWPHANTMQAVGFVSSESLVNAKVGKGVLVDGGQFFRIPAGSAGVSHQGNPFTVAFWFEPTQLNQGAVVAANNEWSIVTALDSGVFYFELTIDGKILPVTSAPLAVGQFYFLAFGYREAGVNQVWASVNLGDRVTSTHTLGGSINGPFLISGGGAPGIHDDWAIWRREVSATELRQIFNSGNGLPFDEWDKVKVCRSIECCPR